MSTSAIAETRPASDSAPHRDGAATEGRGRLGRGLLIAVAIAYVAVMLFIPLGGIVITVISAGWTEVSQALTSPGLAHAFMLTGVITLITIVVTSVFGVLVSWVLVRQHFHGKGFLNAMVDLPFALSPVTVGLAAVLLFGRGGWFEPFLTAQGIKIMFALPAMILVTVFISLPFTIREVQPVLQELGKDEEDASRTLGASITQTFRRVTLPNIRWALLYGVALSTARSIGEIGAVLVVSGNLIGRTETATLFIYNAAEQRQPVSAYTVALILAGISILLLAGIELAERRIRKERGR